MRPHRRQPTRLPRPWDSPGKNTGVGCHFLLQCMKVKSESEVAQSCLTPSNAMDCSLPGSSIHGIFQAGVLEWGAIAFSGLTEWITTNWGKFFNRWDCQTTWPASWEICMQVRKQQLELDMEKQTGSKLGKESVEAVYCHPNYLTYMQSTLLKMMGWMKHKLESRLPGKISIT